MHILIRVIKVSHEIERLHWATLHGIRRFFKQNCDPSTQDFLYLSYHQRCESVHIVHVHTAKSGFLATVSHHMEFLKDIALKSDGRISHKQDAFSPTTFFLLKIAANICRGALSMTWESSFCTDIHG